LRIGHIPDSAKAHGYQTEARDLVARGYAGTIIADFFQADAASADAVVMNSPYKGDLLEAFVTQAVKVSRRKAAAFAPLARLNAAWPWLRPLPLTRVYGCSSRVLPVHQALTSLAATNPRAGAPIFVA
jgi:hypothetical protein